MYFETVTRRIICILVIVLILKADKNRTILPDHVHYNILQYHSKLNYLIL